MNPKVIKKEYQLILTPIVTFAIGASKITVFVVPKATIYDENDRTNERTNGTSIVSSNMCYHCCEYLEY
jgi:hypothetical protein